MFESGDGLWYHALCGFTVVQKLMNQIGHIVVVLFFKTFFTFYVMMCINTLDSSNSKTLKELTQIHSCCLHNFIQTFLLAAIAQEI